MTGWYKHRERQRRDCYGRISLKKVGSASGGGVLERISDISDEHESTGGRRAGDIHVGGRGRVVHEAPFL